MHYFHLFTNFILPVSFFIGVIGTAIALVGPENHPMTTLMAMQFLQDARGRKSALWQHYGITFVYFIGGLALLQFTQTWHVAGNWMVALSLFWVLRNWLIIKFPARAHVYNSIDIGIRHGKLFARLK